MKTRTFSAWIACLWICTALCARAANLTGEWDFANAGNLGLATVGTDLTINGTAPTYSTAVVDDAGVSQSGVILTKLGTANNLTMAHGIAPNGGGPKVNKYTLLMDVYSPPTSRNQWRNIFQTTLANNDDGDYFISTSNTLGIGELGYSSAFDSAHWQRLVITVDLGTAVKAYVNGALFKTHAASSLNGRFALSPTVLLFADENLENNPFYVAKVAVWDGPLVAAEVEALGAAGSPLAAPTDYSSGTFTAVTHGNTSGYLLDSDADNPAVGYDRDVVKAQAAVGVTWPVLRPAAEVAQYKIVFKLQDELGNFLPLKSADETGADGGFEKWVDQNVACPQSGALSFSANLSANLVPSVRLSPDRQYSIKAILRKNVGAGYADVDPQPITNLSSTQRFLHFQNRVGTGDAAWNVLSRIQFNPSWDRTYTLVTESGQQYHKVTVSGTINRWDEFTAAATSNQTVPVAFSYRLLDVTVPAAPIAIPLLPPSAPPGAVPNVVQRVNATALSVPSYSGSSPRVPATASVPNTTLPVIPADWAQMSPLKKFQLEVQLLHGEQNGTEASETTTITTPDKVLTRLSGKLLCGPIETRISGSVSNIGEPGAPYPQSDAANPGWFKSKLYVPTAKGTLPNLPGATWGGQTYFVRYQPATGDVAFIGDVLNSPFTIPITLTEAAATGTIGNVRFKHVPTSLVDTALASLSSAGASGTLKVYYPTGFGVAPTERSRMLKGSFTTPTQALDSFLQPTAATLTIAGPFWAVEETKPLRFPTNNLTWQPAVGRFYFTASGAPIYVRKVEIDRLNASPVAVDMKVKPSNDLIYSSVVSLGNSGQMEVVAAADGSAWMTCELQLAGNLIGHDAHFPRGARMTFSNGEIKIDRDLIHPSSRLNGVYFVQLPVETACSSCDGINGAENYQLVPKDVPPTSDERNASFTPDGGLQFSGRLAGANFVPAAQDLKWGKFGGGTTEYAHRANGIAEASYFQSGTFLRGDRVGSTVSGGNRPAQLLLLGAPSALDGNAEALPETANYKNGLGDYAGLNIRVGASGLQGQSRIGASAAKTYALRNTNKYYARRGGVNGRHEAAAGYVPGSFMVGGYTLNLTRLGFDLLDSSNSDPTSLPNANAGDVYVGGFANFGLNFSKIELRCNGGLGKLYLPPTQPELMLQYWQTGFLPLTAEFAPNGDGCLPSNATLVMGVKAWANFIPETLVGQIGVKPTGDLITRQTLKEDRPAGLSDSRLQGPPSIKINGPGTSDQPEYYNTALMGEVYFNNPAATGDQATNPDLTPNKNGFLVFPANVDVSFFPNIPVLVHTSGRTSTPGGPAGAPFDNGLIYLTGGWPQAGIPFAQQADWATFDTMDRGFDGPSLAEFRKPTTAPNIANYIPSVRQDWLDLAGFQFKAGWNPHLRDFQGVLPGQLTLPMLDLRADLQHLTASQANVVVDQELNFTIKPNKNAPFISTIDFLSNFNDELGAKRAAFQRGLESKLTGGLLTTAKQSIKDGVQSLRNLLEDKLDIFGKPSFDPAANAMATSLLTELLKPQVLNDIDTLPDKARAAIQGQINAALNAATGGLETKLSSLIYDDILDSRAGQAVQHAVSVAAEVNKQITAALDIVQTFEMIIAAEDVTDPNGFTERKRHLLRNIAKELLKSELAGAMGNALDQALGIYISRLESGFAYVESILKNVLEPALLAAKTALDSALSIAAQVKATLEEAANFVPNLVAQINAEVAQQLAMLDFTRGNPLRELSQAELAKRIQQVVNDAFKGSIMAKQLTTLTKQSLGDPFAYAQESIHDLLDMLTEAVNLALGERDPASNGPLTNVFQPYKDAMKGVTASAKLKGYALTKGDAFEMLRLDGRMKLSAAANLDFEARGSLELKRIQSKGTSGCLYSPDREWAEATLSLDQAKLAVSAGGLGPLANAAGGPGGGGMNMNAKLTFTLVGTNAVNPNDSKSKVVGLNGALELSPSVAGGGMKLGSASMGGGKLMFAAGEKEVFIAGRAQMGYQGVSATGGMFMGKSCSLDAIREFAPDVLHILDRPDGNNGPYAGVFFHSDAAMPLETLLGIPKTPLLDVTVKFGASHFIDLQSPAEIGMRYQGEAEGSLLGLVRVREGMQLISRKSLENWWDLHAEGTADYEVELGSDPFSATAHIEFKQIYHNGKYDYHLNYPSWVDDFIDLF